MDTALKGTYGKKVAQAKGIIDAWCRVQKCTADDIPVLAEDTTCGISVGVLAFTIATHVDMGVMPTADLLGINAGHMTELRNLAYDRIKKRVGHARKIQRGLLGEARRASRAKALARAKQRADSLSRLELESDAIITATLMLLDDAPHHMVMGGSLLIEHVEMRQIVVAVLFHHVANRHNKSILARHLRCSVHMITYALDAVSYALRSDRRPVMKRKALAVCDGLRIDPEKLKL
ncbi:MAG: hypothetical protein JWM46_266 [Candidatus Kaiserbacteria bacterium]|nr:hypothetical protein [Candidatus Kaiserbacteria bacterium]